jgi:hypothetical protein
MAAISRREFIKRSALLSGMGGIVLVNSAELRASPLGLPMP